MQYEFNLGEHIEIISDDEGVPFQQGEVEDQVRPASMITDAADAPPAATASPDPTNVLQQDAPPTLPPIEAVNEPCCPPPVEDTEGPHQLQQQASEDKPQDSGNFDVMTYQAMFPKSITNEKK